MKCTKCGGHAPVATGIRGDRNPFERALNVFSRWRVCGCGRRFKTFEVDAADLSELRRRAYLFELSQRGSDAKP